MPDAAVAQPNVHASAPPASRLRILVRFILLTAIVHLLPHAAALPAPRAPSASARGALRLRGGVSATVDHLIASDGMLVSTTPFEGQKPGTSGLRKKTSVFMQRHYLENFVQCLFETIGEEKLKGATLVVSGDGRYHNDQAIQTICRMAAANGVARVWVGRDGLLSTPAASAVIREREGGKAIGGIVLTASHNPGGPDNDFGIKYNVQNGGPALEAFTGEVHTRSQKISEYRICSAIPPIDLSQEARHLFRTEAGGAPLFEVEVINPVEDYLNLLRRLFDLRAVRELLARPDMSFEFDAMHGVAGPYAVALFADELGVPPSCLRNCEPKTDFGGGHPDPNLTYAHELVKAMGLTPQGSPTEEAARAAVLGAAADGDADRNMILGRGCFVTPSDSVAIIAAHSHALPWLSKEGGLKALARSMPTSGALDRVAQALGLPLFETPTGWKYFGNLMDSHLLGGKLLSPLICGEESFGTGSSHIREKDGLWAVLCWLSLLADKNRGVPNGKLLGVDQILREHWATFGRNYYARYDYENVDGSRAAAMMARLAGMAEMFKLAGLGEERPLQLAPGFDLVNMDEFSYADPVDGSVTSKQGLRMLFADGSRIVLRLSGTGSVGATVRVYLEQFQPPGDEARLSVPTAEALAPLSALALQVADVRGFTGRDEPTVIT